MPNPKMHDNPIGQINWILFYFYLQNLGVVLINFLASALGASFSDADRAAWTTAIQGINTIVESAL